MEKNKNIPTTTMDRLVGLEVEYKQSGSDNIPNPENEYYNGMKEINRILLPMHKGKTLDTLKTIKNVLVGINKRTGRKLGTYHWSTGYGHAFNGLHLHISHKISKKLLTKNILRVIDKWGQTPRIATSWHVRAQPSHRGFKAKSKYTPVHVTPRGTTEIRILDIEYFYDDEILKDIATAIDYSTNEILKEVDFGSESWFYQDCYNEDTGKLLMSMESNMATWYTKIDEMTYANAYTNDVVCFQNLYERNREDFSPSTKFQPVIGTSKHETKTLKETKVSDIFKIEAPKLSKNSDSVHFTLDGKPVFSLKYDMKDRCARGKLIHLPLAMAHGIRTKVFNNMYKNIPNDIFIYLDREFRGELSINDTDELDKFATAKIKELLQLN